MKKGVPKAIVHLNENYTILDLQIANLKKILGIELKDIVVVVGYKKHIVMEKYPELTFVNNDNYQTTCTAKSLLKGLEKVGNKDVLCINGDLVFDSDILDLVIKNKEYNVLMVTNKYYRASEIKYNIDEQGFVKEVSKNLQNGLGELIGMNMIKKSALPILISNLKESDNIDYFDIALQKTINDGFKFNPIDIKDKFSIEIDYQNELEIAQKWVERNYQKI